MRMSSAGACKVITAEMVLAKLTGTGNIRLRYSGNLPAHSGDIQIEERVVCGLLRFCGITFDKLNLASMKLEGGLSFERCIFTEQAIVDLTGIEVTGSVEFRDCLFESPFVASSNFESAAAAPTLDERLGFAAFDRIRTTGRFELRGCKCTRMLSLRSARIGASLRLRAGCGAQTGDTSGDGSLPPTSFDGPNSLLYSVLLDYTRIGGSADFGGTTFHGPVWMRRADVRGDCAFSWKPYRKFDLDKKGPTLRTIFKKAVDLHNTHVLGHLSLRGAKVEDKFRIDNMTLGALSLRPWHVIEASRNDALEKSGQRAQLAGQPWVQTELSKDGFTAKGTRVLGFANLDGVMSKGPIDMRGLRADRLSIGEFVSDVDGVEAPRVAIESQGSQSRINLPNCRIEERVDMNGLTCDSGINMSGAIVKGDIAIRDSNIGGFSSPAKDRRLNKATSAEISGLSYSLLLAEARIGGYVSLTGSTFTHGVSLGDAVIGSNVYAEGSTFNMKGHLPGVGELCFFAGGSSLGGSFVMAGATLDGDCKLGLLDCEEVRVTADNDGKAFECRSLDLQGSRLKGRLKCFGAHIAGDLLIDGSAIHGVDVAVPGGAALCPRTTICGDIRMDSTELLGHLNLNGAFVGGRIRAQSAAIRGDVHLNFDGKHRAEVGKYVLRQWWERLCSQTKGELAENLRILIERLPANGTEYISTLASHEVWEGVESEARYLKARPGARSTSELENLERWSRDLSKIAKVQNAVRSHPNAVTAADLTQMARLTMGLEGAEFEPVIKLDSAHVEGEFRFDGILSYGGISMRTATFDRVVMARKVEVGNHSIRATIGMADWNDRAYSIRGSSATVKNNVLIECDYIASSVTFGATSLIEGNLRINADYLGAGTWSHSGADKKYSLDVERASIIGNLVVIANEVRGNVLAKQARVRGTGNVRLCDQGRNVFNEAEFGGDLSLMCARRFIENLGSARNWTGFSLDITNARCNGIVICETQAAAPEAVSVVEREGDPPFKVSGARCESITLIELAEHVTGTSAKAGTPTKQDEKRGTLSARALADCGTSWLVSLIAALFALASCVALLWTVKQYPQVLAIPLVATIWLLVELVAKLQDRTPVKNYALLNFLAVSDAGIDTYHELADVQGRKEHELEATLVLAGRRKQIKNMQNGRPWYGSFKVSLYKSIYRLVGFGVRPNAAFIFVLSLFIGAAFVNAPCNLDPASGPAVRSPDLGDTVAETLGILPGYPSSEEWSPKDGGSILSLITYLLAILIPFTLLSYTRLIRRL